MKIKEVSALLGLSADTLRYYERIGLIRNVHRDKNGIRNYSEENCQVIQFIKCMRAANISIEGLIEYTDLYAQGDSTRNARKAILTRERDLLKQRIAHMEEALERLNKKIAAFDNCQL